MFIFVDSLNLYARFLDLDQEAIVADLDIELGASPRKASRKSLGSITKDDSNDSADYSTSNKIKSSDLKSTQDNFSKPLILSFDRFSFIFYNSRDFCSNIFRRWYRNKF